MKNIVHIEMDKAVVNFKAGIERVPAETLERHMEVGGRKIRFIQRGSSRRSRLIG